MPEVQTGEPRTVDPTLLEKEADAITLKDFVNEDGTPKTPVLNADSAPGDETNPPIQEPEPQDIVNDALETMDTHSEPEPTDPPANGDNGIQGTTTDFQKLYEDTLKEKETSDKRFSDTQVKMHEATENSSKLLKRNEELEGALPELDKFREDQRQREINKRFKKVNADALREDYGDEVGSLADVLNAQNEVIVGLENKVNGVEGKVDNVDVDRNRQTADDLIANKHPDAWDLMKSGEVKNWISKMPNAVIRNGVEATLEKGSPDDVIQVFDSFKKSSPNEFPAFVPNIKQDRIDKAKEISEPTIRTPKSPKKVINSGNGMTKAKFLKISSSGRELTDAEEALVDEAIAAGTFQ